MSSTAEIIFQIAEAISAISLPVGGGLAAYAKWRRSAERDRRVREETARLASEKATKDARADEQQMRDKLLQEKDDRIAILNEDLAKEREENARLHEYIMTMLSGNRQQIPPNRGADNG